MGSLILARRSRELSPGSFLTDIPSFRIICIITLLKLILYWVTTPEVRSRPVTFPRMILCSWHLFFLWLSPEHSLKWLELCMLVGLVLGGTCPSHGYQEQTVKRGHPLTPLKSGSVGWHAPECIVAAFPGSRAGSPQLSGTLHGPGHVNRAGPSVQTTTTSRTTPGS